MRAVKQRGFSLLELLITMGIAAILVAIAAPSYQYHQLTAQRRTAEASLLQIANALEGYFDANDTYRGATDAIPIPHSTRYDFELDNRSDTDYRIKAIPKQTQTGERCGTLWLEQSGERGGQQSNCWD